MINLLVLSRDEIARFSIFMPYVVISIREPDLPAVTIPGEPPKGHVVWTSGVRAILRLAFQDVPRPELSTRPMNARDARRIAAFVQRWQYEVALIVVQCDAGVSRSAAVAAAISDYLNGDCAWAFKHFRPNRYVYNLTVRALLTVEGGRGRSEEHTSELQSQ